VLVRNERESGEVLRAMKGSRVKGLWAMKGSQAKGLFTSSQAC
jgi:hypothetical protein